MERENLFPKRCVKIMLFGVMLCGFLFASQTAEYAKAQATFKERSEVYFRFDVASHEEFKKTGLFNDISIDRVTEGEIIAYANQKGFDKFVKHNYYYEVLTPPSLLIDPPMSDTWHDPERGTRFDFYSYPTYDAYLEQMNYYAEAYPDNCILDTLGWTDGNDHVMV